MASSLKTFLEQKSRLAGKYTPLIFDLSKPRDRTKLHKLVRARKVETVLDSHKDELEEYFQILNPRLSYTPEFPNLFKKYLEELTHRRPLWQQGRWAYFPWKLTLVHILEERNFLRVRTARNRNLISETEQKKFYNGVLGIAGLSVGNSVALAIVMQGGAKHIRLADHDTLSLSNTNRIRVGVDNLGLSKVIMTARQIYEINPYSKVKIFPEGLNEKNIKRFMSGLEVIVDEVDNLAIKYLIREYARKLRIPIVMGADNGDNAVVDIERYDRNRGLKFFHGKMGNINYNLLKKLDKFGTGKLITKHIGPENVTGRMRASLLAMGKTIVSWPQLGGAALINGAAVAYAVRKILTGEPLESTRALISLDEKMIPGYGSAPARKKRKQASDEFRKIFGL